MVDNEKKIKILLKEIDKLQNENNYLRERTMEGYDQLVIDYKEKQDALLKELSDYRQEYKKELNNLVELRKNYMEKMNQLLSN